MAFFSSITPTCSGNTLMPKYPKRAVMHVDQVVIQTEQVQGFGTNNIPNLQVTSPTVSSIEYMNDENCGPPQRKKMKHNSHYSRKTMTADENMDGVGSFPEQAGAPPQLWTLKYPREDPSSPLALSKRPSKQVTESSSDSLSDADYEWLQDRALDSTGQGPHKRSRKNGGARRTRGQGRSSLEGPSEPASTHPHSYDSPLPPVEVQIQECPGLPKMRAYVVVPLGKGLGQQSEALELAARRAASAVPPSLRVTRRPQAVVVQCGRHSLSATGNLPCNTNIPLAIESSEAVFKSWAASAPCTAPATHCQETAIGQITSEKRVESEASKSAHEPRSEEPKIHPAHNNFTDTNSFAHMDCRTFICRLTNTLDV